MRQTEGGPGDDQQSVSDPAADAGAGVAEPQQPHPPRRQRYGRTRGPVPAGEVLVARLGPADGEPFASLDDDHGPEPAPRPGPDTRIDELRFVALDCETTGQTPHRLVELGAVAFTLDRHLLSFETLIHSNDRINPYARRIHGINSELLAGAPRVEPVLERFRRFVSGTVLVEHSADAFDTRLIARAMGQPVEADNLDTSRLAGKLWDLRDTIGLERLCGELGVTHRRPHHALADAEATAACFIKLVALGTERFGWATLADLLADGQPPPPRFSEGQGRRPARPVPAPPPSADTEGTQRRRRRRGGRRRRSPAPAPDAAGTGPVPTVSGSEPEG